MSGPSLNVHRCYFVRHCQIRHFQSPHTPLALVIKHRYNYKLSVREDESNNVGNRMINTSNRVYLIQQTTSCISLSVTRKLFHVEFEQSPEGIHRIPAGALLLHNTASVSNAMYQVVWICWSKINAKIPRVCGSAALRSTRLPPASRAAEQYPAGSLRRLTAQCYPPKQKRLHRWSASTVSNPAFSLLPACNASTRAVNSCQRTNWQRRNRIFIRTVCNSKEVDIAETGESALCSS